MPGLIGLNRSLSKKWALILTFIANPEAMREQNRRNSGPRREPSRRAGF
jgi:hypothetical protein